ncbi:PilZ domain-containing protein [Pseudomonas sp. MWU13-2105]|uniref:PilZ domain-containing protein n=1 Tax=Pseudomonas sp. MWU13-2105 TaxID=2935074 RepID=UPI0020101E16|nr:PilZ domain-containing protein [Pseudomonas sp. MWU13-2105]
MSRTDQDYSEKRDYIRMRVEADVTLIHAGLEISATCLDLSSSGMQIAAPRAFKAGDQLLVRIESDHPSLKGLEAETEVVWVHDEGGGQRLGLQILKMN